MPYSSDHDSTRDAAIRKPDPFVSLNATQGHRRRFWLFELFMSPFEDHDERATYRIAGKESEAKSHSGIRVNKAWNGNGAPSPTRQGRRATADEPVEADGLLVAHTANRGPLFNSVDRRRV